MIVASWLRLTTAYSWLVTMVKDVCTVIPIDIDWYRKMTMTNDGQQQWLGEQLLMQNMMLIAGVETADFPSLVGRWFMACHPAVCLDWRRCGNGGLAKMFAHGKPKHVRFWRPTSHPENGDISPGGQSLHLFFSQKGLPLTTGPQTLFLKVILNLCSSW